MAVIILTTGVPGCGKTYIRCARFLVDDFLVNSNGKHISNFPLCPSVIAEDVSKKINASRGFFGIFRKKVKPSEIESRLEVIPDTVLQSWRLGLSGPWDYFQGRDLKYCHIAIDEIHNFISSRQSAEVLQKWDEFLGEVRHRGCTFEGLTQDISQVDQVLTGRASTRLELVPGEDMRDPFFKIKLSDWYELKAAFTGFYHKTVFVLEKRKQDSRWKTNHTTRFFINPDYFKYYNSFNASLQEKASGEVDENRAPAHEYQKRGKISLLFWFVRRNFFSLFFRIVIAILLFWLLLCGGLSKIINLTVSSLLVTSRLNGSKSEKKVVSSVPASVSSTPLASAANGVPGSSVLPRSGSASEKNLALIKYEDEKKEREKNAFKPGLFFNEFCWLQSGIRIFPGFKFTDQENHGAYFGKTVVSIDSKDRTYTLDDGSIVSMF